MIIRYPDIASLRSAYIDNVGPDGAKTRSLLSTRDAWFNNETIADTLRLSLSGDTTLVAAAEQQLAKMDHVIETPRRQWTSGPAGAYAVVPEVIAGLPTPMRYQSATADEHAPIELFVCTNSVASVSTETIRNRGTTILALTMALARVRPIALYQVFTGNGNKDGTGETILISQINTAPLDLAIACYVLTSAGFARRLTYGLGAALNGYEGNAPLAYFSDRVKYENALIKRIALDPSRSMYLGRSDPHDLLITHPLQWIAKQINRFISAQEEQI